MSSATPASTSSTMRALVLRSPNDPASIESVERPVLSLEHDLLVEIRAIATNPIDLKHKLWKKDDNLHVAGFDAAGVVVAAGTSSYASAFKVGDEVYFAAGLGRHGAFAEFALIDARLAAHKPKSLSFADASAFPLVAITAWETLHELMRVKAGKSIFILGAAGGVGSICIQLAKLAGLKVIASASRDETRTWVKELGADFVVDHSKNLESEFAAQGLPLVDYIFNTVSLKLLPTLVPLIAPFGHIVGVNPDSDIAQPVLRDLFFKRAQFSMQFRAARTLHGIDIETHGAILAQLAALIDEGKIKKITQPGSSDTFKGFEGLVEAEKVQTSGKAIGKLVVTIKQ